MKKILLVALMALCGVSFSFGKNVVLETGKDYSTCVGECLDWQVPAVRNDPNVKKSCENNCENAGK